MTDHLATIKMCRNCAHARSATGLAFGAECMVVFCHIEPNAPGDRVYPTHYCANWLPRAQEPTP
jgi:hypothetical protein